MANEATLHIKVDSQVARGLKDLARKRKKTMGELVRQALTACYQADFLGLSQRQSQALAAYAGGYISLGKLAEVMGMPALQLRSWLTEHGIPQNSSYGEEDAANA